ncbi:single-stranded DNA-binding protein [Microbacterium sp. LWH11-1.2]|uniref:single-stranded DNA-binding protein n=1 Tax=Microbacterium sp. LWH11-1.2 TaxID=3135258 RepID=UPI003139C63B
MSKATTTIEGFVAKDPELGNHQGKAVTNVSIPHTPRRLNKQTNQWEDAGATLWVQASFWEADAEAIVAAVRKGTLVTVTGQPELRVFQKTDGTTDAALSIRFGTLGVIPRAEQPSAQSAPAPAQSDAWTTPGSFGDDTPF